MANKRCKIVHLRTVPLAILHSFLEQFDLNLKTCILQCSLSCGSWSQTTLPFCLSGLGLHSYHSATAAFLDSCNNIHLLASQFLSLEFHELTFPDEDVAATVFEKFYSNLSISVASQHDLQVVLDQHKYD